MRIGYQPATGSRAGEWARVVNHTAIMVWVRRQWNDWRRAKYRVDQIAHVGWDTISGGVRVPASQPFLHGYVQCDVMAEGELAHSGAHGPCPHRIKVCIVKKDNDPQVYAALVSLAGEKPRRNRKPRTRPKRPDPPRWRGSEKHQGSDGKPLSLISPDQPLAPPDPVEVIQPHRRKAVFRDPGTGKFVSRTPVKPKS